MLFGRTEPASPPFVINGSSGHVARPSVQVDRDTHVWPKDPQYLYQVEEGTNEGLYVEVLHRDANGKSVQLLVVKFLTSIKAAGACLGYVSEFLESFDPEQLRTA